jgi:phage shock protein A
MATKLNEGTEVALPLRNIVSMIAFTSLATWAYFGVVERLNQIETSQTMMKTDLEQNTEFRIKWPRGEMGSLPADNEQFLMIEHLASELEKLTDEIEEGRAPYDQQQKLTLEFYEKRINNLEDKIEQLRANGHSK